jgi:hypothetical protein
LGIYQHLILPRLINTGMRNKRLEPLRARQVALARGRVLEIGIGSGHEDVAVLQGHAGRHA